MKLIKPKQISGEIMTLIEEADKKLIIICPYYNIANWQKLHNSFKHARSKGIEIEFYVRQREKDSIQQVKDFGFTPIEILNLHTKLYINEKYAIISSMNLNLSSDTNSLDIAYKTETETEYNEIIDYYERYLKQAKSIKVETSILDNTNSTTFEKWENQIKFNLSKILNESVSTKIKISTKTLEIRAGEKYEAFIQNERINNLRISVSLFQEDFDFIKYNLIKVKSLKSKVEAYERQSFPRYTVWATVENLKSFDIIDLHNEDRKIVVDEIVNFVASINNLRNSNPNKKKPVY